MSDVPLREHLERELASLRILIDERDRRYEERAAAQVEAVRTALAAGKAGLGWLVLIVTIAGALALFAR